MANSYYALVTGASSGIGKHLAYELASRGKNLLLVSLPNENLSEVANKLSKEYSVKTAFFEVDLSKKDGPQQVFNWTLGNSYELDILINNAGIAGTSEFEKSTLEYIDDRLQVNIRALTLLCRLYLPELKKRKKSKILNVGSLSAFYSIPFKAVYSAGKAYVVNFSRALNAELKGSDVSISVLNPNGVHTNKGTHARISAHGNKGKISAVDAGQLAKIAIDGMNREKFMIIPGWVNKFLYGLSKVMPQKIEQRILYKEFYKEVLVS